ncbi:hypothetical protein [Fredinandcohnia sp. 179-A 10B2 NHS]|uniref:hypothetical protein n=1 Tax=Fredinandcohnia sp. 179-A 10B2 NHS TaxID=3235176 RepID=UPI0039A131B6
MSTIVMSILPILIFAVIFIFLYMIQRNASFKGVRLVVSIYMGILLLATILYYFLPDTHFVWNEQLDNGKSPQWELDRYDAFYNAAMDGTIEDYEGVKKKETWSFPYQEKELDITSLDNLQIFTVFERKESNDDMIELAYYVGNTVYKGIDTYADLSGPSVLLQGQELRVDNPKEYQLTFASFHKDFVISQFKGNGIDEEFDYNEVDHPADFQVLYIKIPKDLTLTGTEFVNYVGDQE